ncbi:MAG: hypothetical protein N3D11_14055, partial [Candidatus Sumerlaeia bacterium]|nr:hypothetical protein [Candidatus Sumerlaeia bacterium]
MDDMDVMHGRRDATGRILVAMSGGVDSAVAAARLCERGYEVVGVNMRVWRRQGPTEGKEEEGIAEAGNANGKQKFDPRGEGRSCCSPRDVADARAVAERLGIPFYALDVEREFEEAVVKPFVAEYLRGRTPNPCVRCNQTMKLGVLLAKARQYGCAAVATGHYVRIGRAESGRWRLRRAADRSRDQSYYLFSLSQEQLEHFMVPLGALTKSEVRRVAAQLGLPVADKPGSQEI